MGAPKAITRTQAGGIPDDAETAALAIAQDLWGQGHLSPLEEILESQSLIALAPNKTSKLAVVAPHLGQRLQRYSRETGHWIDAFENQTGLARFVREKGLKASLKAWDRDAAGMLGIAKFTDVLMFQPSQLCGNLALLYAQVAKSLRSGGRAFVGDLAAAPTAYPEGTRPLEEHQQALAGAGFHVGQAVELSRELSLKIRRSFLKSTERLPELRRLPEPEKTRMTGAYFAQLGYWAAAGALLEANRLGAFGLVATVPA